MLLYVASAPSHLARNLQVWSNSKKSWRDGQVLEVAPLLAWDEWVKVDWLASVWRHEDGSGCFPARRSLCQAFPTACQAEGFAVPAGTVKVRQGVR